MSLSFSFIKVILHAVCLRKEVNHIFFVFRSVCHSFWRLYKNTSQRCIFRTNLYFCVMSLSENKPTIAFSEHLLIISNAFLRCPKLPIFLEQFVVLSNACLIIPYNFQNKFCVILLNQKKMSTIFFFSENLEI